MVVPVEVALGSGTPRAWRARFLLWLLKSKPGIVAVMSKGSEDVCVREERRVLVVFVGSLFKLHAEVAAVACCNAD